MLEALLKSRYLTYYCSPYIHTISYLTTGSSQIGQVRFALDKTGLAVPSSFFL